MRATLSLPLLGLCGLMSLGSARAQETPSQPAPASTQAPSAPKPPAAPVAAPPAAPIAPAAPAPQAAAPAPQELKPLGFGSQKLPFHWDRLIPLQMEVDGLKLNSIFFNDREIRSGILKGANFGTRAQVEVTNTSKRSRVPGFAVAVFDADGALLGVASGGTKVGSVSAGATESFDLNFRYVKERLSKGAYFVLCVELKP